MISLLSQAPLHQILIRNYQSEKQHYKQMQQTNSQLTGANVKENAIVVCVHVSNKISIVPITATQAEFVKTPARDFQEKRNPNFIARISLH